MIQKTPVRSVPYAQISSSVWTQGAKPTPIGQQVAQGIVIWSICRCHNSTSGALNVPWCSGNHVHSLLVFHKATQLSFFFSTISSYNPWGCSSSAWTDTVGMRCRLTGMKVSSLQGVPDRSDLPKTTRLCTWKEGRRATVRIYTVYPKITFSLSNM